MWRHMAGQLPHQKPRPPSQRSLSEQSLGKSLFLSPILCCTALLLCSKGLLLTHVSNSEIVYLLIHLFIFSLPTTSLSPPGQEVGVHFL